MWHKGERAFELLTNDLVGNWASFLFLIWRWQAAIWCFARVSVTKLFLAVCSALAAVSVDSDRVADYILWPPLCSQTALEVFCSHNTLALRRSSREATNCPLRKMLKAKWIGDEWCRMIGLATLLCGLIPRLLGALARIHFSQNAFLKIIYFVTH